MCKSRLCADHFKPSTRCPLPHPRTSFSLFSSPRDWVALKICQLDIHVFLGSKLLTCLFLHFNLIFMWNIYLFIFNDNILSSIWPIYNSFWVTNININLIKVTCFAIDGISVKVEETSRWPIQTYKKNQSYVVWIIIIQF